MATEKTKLCVNTTLLTTPETPSESLKINQDKTQEMRKKYTQKKTQQLIQDISQTIMQKIT